MERRKYLLSAGTVAVSAVAGCLGGGSVEPTFEIIADPPTQVQVTDITAEPDSSELTGEGLVVSGTLENTGDVDIRVPRIDAVFYGEEDVRLDDSYNFGETSETIAPGEKVRFEVVYLGDPSEVSRYTLAFSDSTPGYSTTSTPTDTETPTPTPEPVEESFSDGFETVEIDSSPDWTLDLRDKRATSQLEADARIVAESAPDGGDHSLAISTSNGGYSIVSTSQTFRWDAPWVFTGLFKADVTDPRRATHLLRLYGGNIELRLGFDRSVAGVWGEAVQPTDVDIGEWTDDTWYSYTCEHDGDGEYALFVWEAAESRPEDPTVTARGNPPSDDEQRFEIWTYAGGEFSVNHAFVSYETL